LSGQKGTDLGLRPCVKKGTDLGLRPCVKI
jgi:hypothetical protein